MSFFDDLQAFKELTIRTSESVGGPFGDPFNEIGTIVSVSDPKRLGRVKALYAGMTSDWMYVQGSHKGHLSSQYIGAPCLISKAGGNTGDAFVSQIFNKDPRGSGVGTPIQLTVIGEQMEASNSSSDPGMKCNEDNAGRIYLLENEINQDVVICLRRSNTQEGGDQVYAWKSLTHGKMVEKGFDPGVTDSQTTTDLSKKVGLPKCSKALEGEIREFAEDRKFRSTMLTCRRDENGDFSWMPVSSPPVDFRTTLPPCTEKNHGMQKVVDTGLDSESVMCLRYQKQMKWVSSGSRKPIQFHKEDPPPTREEFLSSKKPVGALAQNASPSSQDFVGQAGDKVLEAAGKAVAPVSPDSKLKPPTQSDAGFDGKQVLSDLGKLVIASNSGLSVDAITSQIASAMSKGGVIDEDLEKVLKVLGGAGDAIFQGIKSNSLESAFNTIGRNSFNQAFNGLPAQVASVYSAYMSGGALGAIDSAAMIGLSKLPPEVSRFVAPVWDLGQDVISNQPVSIKKVLGSALGALESSLPDSINQIITVAGGAGGISEILSGEIFDKLSKGDLGEIAKMASNFANLPGLRNLGGLQGVPQLATSALQLVGLGGQFTSLLGPAGLGLSGFSALTGINPVSAILGGVPGLGGLFNSGSDCPCDPKCRKTQHGEDSDGNKLLDPCGSVIASNHSSYAPNGDPTDNNNNPVSAVLNLIPTKIGEDLCNSGGNQWDLTQLIKNVKRLSEMADRLEGAKHADWPELWSELTYTFEAVEKAFKQTDNNITKVESIERKLIDAQYRLINNLMVGNSSFLSQTFMSIVETSKAIKDTYDYVKALDNVKNGGKLGVTPTNSMVNVFDNIVKIARLNALSKKEAKFITDNFLKSAHDEWKELEPAKDLVNITDFVLGAIPKSLPATFGNCKTKRDKDKVLKDSLEAKINSPVPPEPDSLLNSLLPSKYFDKAFDKQKEISSILDQINYEQGRSKEGKADC
jgi:hypothetical protein